MMYEFYLSSLRNSRFYPQFFNIMQFLALLFLTALALGLFVLLVTTFAPSLLIAQAGAGILWLGFMFESSQRIVSPIIGNLMGEPLIRIGMWLGLVEDRIFHNRGDHLRCSEDKRKILKTIEEAFDSITINSRRYKTPELYTYLKKWHKELWDGKKDSLLIADEIAAYLFILDPDYDLGKMLQGFISMINSLTPDEEIPAPLKSNYKTLTINKIDDLLLLPKDLAILTADYLVDPKLTDAYKNDIESTAYIYRFLQNKTLWKNHIPTGVRKIQDNLCLENPTKDLEKMKEIARQRLALGNWRTWRADTTHRFYNAVLNSHDLKGLALSLGDQYRR